MLLVENGGAEAARLREILGATASERFEIADATHIDDALQALRDLSNDVLLLDLSARGGGDLEPLLRARVAAVDTPIVVLAGAGSEEDAIRVLRAGAQEYLTKEECSALRWPARSRRRSSVTGSSGSSRRPAGATTSRPPTTR